MSNRPFMLQYDVPETNGVPVCNNPSDELWHEGCVRITYSVWLVMEADIPYLLLNRLRSAGVRWYLVPFADDATAELRTMAVENIRREIAEHMRRAEETRAQAEQRLDDESDAQFRRRRNQYLAAARSIETRVTEMVQRVGPAAQKFGITHEELGLAGALQSVELMGSNMRARAEAYANAHGLLTRRGRTSGDAASMARSLRRKEVPAPIAADFLTDLEDDEAKEAGDELRSSFGF